MSGEKSLNKIAQEFFIGGDFLNAKNLYEKLNMLLELAYCELYLGNFEKAKKIVSMLQKNSPAVEWINTLLQMIETNLVDYPTYLQIRNFYEIDLNNLFLCGQKQWIENVINHVPLLASLNPEVFKLTARVLKNNNQDELAKRFLKKSLDIYFYDSETHFLLAEIYLKENEVDIARKHLRYACENGNYFPAEKLLEKINFS